jgi:hypothetical protein
MDRCYAILWDWWEARVGGEKALLRIVGRTINDKWAIARGRRWIHPIYGQSRCRNIGPLALHNEPLIPSVLTIGICVRSERRSIELSLLHVHVSRYYLSCGIYNTIHPWYASVLIEFHEDIQHLHVLQTGYGVERNIISSQKSVASPTYDIVPSSSCAKPKRTEPTLQKRCEIEGCCPSIIVTQTHMRGDYQPAKLHHKNRVYSRSEPRSFRSVERACIPIYLQVEDTSDLPNVSSAETVEMRFVLGFGKRCYGSMWSSFTRSRYSRTVVGKVRESHPRWLVEQRKFSFCMI